MDATSTVLLVLPSFLKFPIQFEGNTIFQVEAIVLLFCSLINESTPIAGQEGNFDSLKVLAFVLSF